MAGEQIKLFQFNLTMWRTLGIGVPQTNTSRHTFNSIPLIFIICSAQFVIALLAYFWYDAISMAEYGATITASITVMKSIFDYVIVIWKIEEISTSIEYCERFIETSKTAAACNSSRIPCQII